MSRVPYGVVDATPGWVAQRLEALAGALKLPRRDAFLFPSGPDFARQCTASLITLQESARAIARFLGLRCDAVVVAFRRLPVPAHIEREGAAWFIEVDSQWQHDGAALAAILAHECCHILLDEQRVTTFGTAVDEVHVDLAVMLSGLGALPLDAIIDRIDQQNGRQVRHHRSFGYLRAPLMLRAYARVAVARGLSRREATARLTRLGTRLAVAWWMMWLRLRPGRVTLPVGDPARPIAAAPMPGTRLPDRLAQRWARLGALDQIVAVVLVAFVIWTFIRLL